ncbi:MAG: hemolysin family protein [Nitriliruptoraceae bacterium]
MSDPALLVSVAAAVLLLVLTTLLAAIETVVTRMSVVRALRLAEEQDESPRAVALLWLTEHRARSLDALLAITVTARITLAAVVVHLVTSRGGAGWTLVLAVVLTVVTSLVVGEVVPRTLVLRYLEAAGLRLARLGRGLVRFTTPLSTAMIAAGRALLPRHHEVSGPHAGDDELRALSGDETDEDDALEPEERAMIRSIFELGDTLAREVMVPRPDVTTVERTASMSEVVRTAVEGGYSRLPVHAADDVDELVGVVYAKDLLRRLANEDGGEGWTDLIRPPTFVPETKRLDDLLRELQADAVHLALVVDEYGEFVGIVTIEDVLEEIVGEIVDEHDREEPLVEPLADGRLRVDARLGVDDLNELLSLELPEEGWDTLGGLVFATLGRLPRSGERIELEGTVLEVEALQGRRIASVLVTVDAPAVSAGAPAAGRDGDGARGPADTGPAADPS